jgi:adenosylhomocysteine nucleosidase
VVVAAGMGAARATLAVEAVLSCESITTLISAGLAGACLPLVHPGTVLEASVVVDVNTGEKMDSSYNEVAEHHLVLATTDSIASVQEKRRLAETYGASMVDMEAATVARLALASGLRFRAIKAISDAHDFELDSLGAFADSNGQFRTLAFALHTAVRPTQWPGAIELGRNSSLALKALDARLREVIEQP